MTILEVERLTKVFAGGVTAVDDVSFSLAEGEFVTLLGPSGCGKTTMLRLIAGFESPDAGRILLGGRDVTDDPPHKRQVNTVFQDYALFPHMNVGENVGYGLRIAGASRAETSRRVQEALATVDLLGKIDATPAQLSGGQRQRVALARAIIRRPKVLLLDEPLSALDVKLREAMQVELRHLHQKLRITFILVTHDQKEALVLSDRVMVVDRGRIVQSGTPSQLYERPASPYVADFIGTANLLPATIVGQEGDVLVAAVGEGRIRAAGAARSYAPGTEVLLAIRPEKVLLDDRQGGHGSNLAGKIVETLFQGNTLRLKLEVGNGAPFAVDLPLRASMAQTRPPAAGAVVGLAIDPGNVIVFPAEPRA
jgi:putative spermidine/putrescine transport system ATP-binding protein/spermidine/putrescine transport system ATP-binding protein